MRRRILLPNTHHKYTTEYYVTEKRKAMWKEVMEKFEGSPSQKKVIELLLERGFQMSPEGKVASGGIEIPHTQIANEIGVDRRVVDMTAKRILGEPTLKKIFGNMILLMGHGY